MPGHKKTRDKMTSQEDAFIKNMEQLAAGGSEEVDFEEKERDTEYGKLFEKYKHRHEDALFEYCFLHNLFFDNTLI